jgi:lipopolysaccharide/colanic/teichoic acid biosynthesis glycosyltransferase
MEIAGFGQEPLIADDVVLEARGYDAPLIGTPKAIYPRYVKRAIDIAGATILLVLLSPLFIIVGVLLIRESPRNVIFRQARIGKDCVPFTCYKFRSMVVDAEQILLRDQRLLQMHASNWKIVSDPRVTRLGRFIRKTSIDELPQLINVIRGDMSLVGPRPYVMSELEEEFGAMTPVITAVRPGMTGLWQVSGRALLTRHQRIELDTEYARSCSPGLDFRIALKTIAVVILGVGAC